MKKKDNFKEHKISIICNDAGAANIILHWILNYQIKNVMFCLKGPALKIFQKFLPKLQNNDLETAIKHSDIILSGTGWSSSLEHDARKVGNLYQKKTIAVIDHWVNYKKRFFFNYEFILPNEIWVTDIFAYKKARSLFKNIRLRLLPNLYLKFETRKVKNNLNPLSKRKGKVLYLLEPIRQKWNTKENIPEEFQALNFFLKNLHHLGLDETSQISLRLHPSEKEDKYDNWLKNNKQFNLKLCSYDESLNKVISKSEWVVGCNSFALVIALKSNIKVACALPVNATECVLPFPEIIKLKDFI